MKASLEHGINLREGYYRSELKGEPARERYLDFLRSGGSVDSIEGLRQAGVDMSSPEPIERAFAILSGYVDRLEVLVD